MRRGFTLIELLIVIFLIGLLVAMAAPAVLQSRNAARRATCLNHQHEVMLAVASFEQAKSRFPGWREQIGAPGKWHSVSWEFALLPHLDRKDLYSSYAPGGAFATSEPHEQVEFFVCPADEPGAATARTSYGVNCGIRDDAPPIMTQSVDVAANGVFHDVDRAWNSNRPLVHFRLGDLVDGARSTIAISDRTEVVNWTDWQKEQRIGLWWQNTLNPPALAQINGVKPPWTESQDKQGWDVRPSSGHSGGVNVSFADGHGQFLNEEIDYLVYALLMTPDGARARMPNGNPVLKEFRTSTIPQGTLGE